MDRIVLVGASLAAVHAIEALRGGGYENEIVLVGRETRLPYDRPPLSKEALRSGERLSLLRGPDWYGDLDVRLELGRSATMLRPGSRTVTLEDGHELGYDGLVLATGSDVRRLGGSLDQHICYLRTLGDAAALYERIADARSVAIIGAGFIGLEVAATLSELGLDVTVVEVAAVPLARELGDEVGRWFRRLHERHGVRMLCGAPAVQVDRRDDHRYQVVVATGTSVVADLVVGAIGATPAVGWLRGSGVQLGDGVLCDSTLRTSAPAVVAAGDVARWYNPLFDEDMRVAHWANAAEQGRHAARTLLGEREPYAAVPYFWSDQFAAKMRFVGRTNAADRVDSEPQGDGSLVVTFWRQGAKIGAVCVNAPRQLPGHRADIMAQAALHLAG